MNLLFPFNFSKITQYPTSEHINFTLFTPSDLRMGNLALFNPLLKTHFAPGL